MTTEKWVPCTEELAENPHKVKAWRSLKNDNLRFIAYDKECIYPIIAKDRNGNLDEYRIGTVQCLIEVPIQERFVTFYEGDVNNGMSYAHAEEARKNKNFDCTHIVKLTYDGENFQVEPVWTKEST